MPRIYVRGIFCARAATDAALPPVMQSPSSRRDKLCEASRFPTQDASSQKALFSMTSPKVRGIYSVLGIHCTKTLQKDCANLLTCRAIHDINSRSCDDSDFRLSREAHFMVTINSYTQQRNAHLLQGGFPAVRCTSAPGDHR